jgi:hypothetical protein
MLSNAPGLSHVRSNGLVPKVVEFRASRVAISDLDGETARMAQTRRVGKHNQKGRTDQKRRGFRPTIAGRSRR